MTSLITRFDITLEHDIDEQYQYEPGEDLRGDVILELSGTIAIKAIMVQIKGEANVSWEDSSKNSSKKSSPQAYQVDEVCCLFILLIRYIYLSISNCI